MTPELVLIALLFSRGVITVEKLSSMLGVSQTVVRECLALLAWDGLVEQGAK